MLRPRPVGAGADPVGVRRAAATCSRRSRPGATGYLVKSASRAELIDAVRRVAAGDTVFTPGLAGLVLGEFRRMAEAGPEPEPDTELTPRETEILKMVAKGMSYRQIADRLVLIAPHGAEPRAEHPAQAPDAQPRRAHPLRHRAGSRR